MINTHVAPGRSWKQTTTRNKRGLAGRHAARPSRRRRWAFSLEQLEQRMLLTVSVVGDPFWFEQGPGPISNGAGAQPPNQITDVEALAAHPTDADILYAATVNGGVWKTTNATAASPSWFTTTDQLPSLGMASIAFSPLDPTFDTLYAGFGTRSTGSNDGPTPAGLLRTTNGGTSWDLVGSDLVGDEIRSVVPTTSGTSVADQVVLVASFQNGVYRSTDGGVSFAQISGAAATTDGVDNDADGTVDEAGELNLPGGGATHLIADPGTASRFYAAIPGQGVFRSDNFGANWQQVNGTGGNTITSAGASVRIELAAESLGGTDVVYAAILENNVPPPGNFTQRLTGVFKSTDSGANWRLVQNQVQPVDNGQGFWHFAIAADPTDTDIFFISGDVTDNAVQRVVTNDGDPTMDAWEPVRGAGANGTDIHDDQKDTVFDADNNLLQATDGGVYRLTQPNVAAARTWAPVNGNMRATEFYSVAYDRLNNVYVGGAQDNGSPRQSSPFSWNWDVQTGCDGGIVQVDNDQVAHPNETIQYTTGQNLSSCGGLVRRTFDNTNTGGAFVNAGLVVNGTGGRTINGAGTLMQGTNFVFDNTRGFTQDFRLNAVNPARMIIGTSFLYESTDMGDSFVPLGGLVDLTNNGVDDDNDAVPDPDPDEWAPNNSVGTVTAVSYGGRRNNADAEDVLYFGSTGATINGDFGQLFLRTANATNSLTDFTALTDYPGTTPRDMVLDPDDWMRGYVLDQNGSVFAFVNGGAATGDWANLTNNLGALSADLRTIELVTPTVGGVVPTLGDDILIVGGQLGVFRQVRYPSPPVPALPAWTEVGLNLPNAITKDLRWDTNADLLSAATWGRGAWSLAAASSVLQAPTALTVCGDEDIPNQDDTILLMRNTANPLLLDVFVNGFLEFQGPQAALNQINVFGVGGNDNLIVDSSNGLITVPDGIRYDGDGTCTPLGFGGEGFDGDTLFGFDRGFDTLTLTQTGGPAIMSDTLAVGALPGSGVSTLDAEADVDGVQTIYFEELEPIVNNVPAPTLTIDEGTVGSILNRANAIQYETSDLFGPTWGKVTIDEFEPIHFSNKTSLVITAENGNDVVNLNNASVPAGLTTITVNGDDGDDQITSRSGVAAAVAVNMNGGAGNDLLDASGVSGPGTLAGGDGDDTIIGGRAADIINGGAGDDTLSGGPVVASVVDTFDGGVGWDSILVEGTAGSDAIDVNQAAAGTLSYTVNGVAQPANVLAVATIEAVQLLAREGDDTIRVTHADALVAAGAPANMLRFDVDGGAPGASDRLTVVDDGLGDTTVQRIGGTPGEGSFTMYAFSGGLPANPIIPLPSVVYTNVEYASLTPIGPVLGGTGTDGAGRLFVFKHDPLEQNQSLATATFLGANQTVNLDPVIDPGIDAPFDAPGDEDWYRIVAETSGTLDIQVYFRQQGTLTNGRAGLPGDGNLDIALYDADGLVAAVATPIAGTGSFGTNDSNNDERIRIPAVAGQTYYLRVVGAALPAGDTASTSAAINIYNLAVINSSPPVPYDLELDDNPANGQTNPPGTQTDTSDTGRSQFDNHTYDNTPTLYFRLDDGIFLHDLPGNDTNDTPPDEVIPIPFRAGPAQPTAAGYAIAIFDEGNTGTQLATQPQTPLGFATAVAGQEGIYTFTTPALSEGSHFLTARVQMIDPADPRQTGWGPRSQSLEIVVDRTPPPDFFGFIGAADVTEGLAAASDSGVAGYPATNVDRVTNDTTPMFYGTAEANAVVRLYVETNGAAGLQSRESGAATPDLLIGEAVAVPTDGTNHFPGGQWQIDSMLDLNSPLLGFAQDGLRRIYTTAEDLAGNITPDANADHLLIFLDTQGPQVTRVDVNARNASYNIWDHKGTPDGGRDGYLQPTPLVSSLVISVRDLPNRSGADPNFLYPALFSPVSIDPGHYQLKGDHNGNIPIASISFTSDPVTDGNAAMGFITIGFFEPLPDDRYTLTLRDGITDRVGNALDGESNTTEPHDTVTTLPSGDGVPGGNFVARFTVDSRPELGVWAAGSVWVDTNGNFEFDPQNPDFVNRDITYSLAFTSDDVFAGDFAPAGAVADGFDKLAAYGRFGEKFRWLIDTDSDGVPDIHTVQAPPAPGINGLPAAGNFDFADPNNPADPGLLNGDEVVLFTGKQTKHDSTWYIDTNHNFLVNDPGDLAVKTPTMTGYPIVGDFDGTNGDDLATYADDVFQIAFNNGDNTFAAPISFRFGFIGVRERPVAADFDQDGFDDLGLWVPDREGVAPREGSEWYILISGGESLTARIIAPPNPGFDFVDGTPLINFTPYPFGYDIYAQFGDEFAIPVVGNFDPPAALASSGTQGGITDGSGVLVFTNPADPLDVDNDGEVSPLDALLIINDLNANGSRSLVGLDQALYYVDVTGDRYLSPLDVLQVINFLNEPPVANPLPASGDVSVVARADSVAAVAAAIASLPDTVARDGSGTSDGSFDRSSFAERNQERRQLPLVAWAESAADGVLPYQLAVSGESVDAALDDIALDVARARLLDVIQSTPKRG